MASYRHCAPDRHGSHPMRTADFARTHDRRRRYAAAVVKRQQFLPRRPLASSLARCCKFGPRVSCNVAGTQQQGRGVEYETLRKYAMVAQQVPIGIRIPNLSWTHHRAISALAPADQRRWLRKAHPKEGGFLIPRYHFPWETCLPPHHPSGGEKIAPSSLDLFRQKSDNDRRWPIPAARASTWP